MTEERQRFPACGNFGVNGNHHGWVVDVLPWVEHGNIAKKWDKDSPASELPNLSLIDHRINVLVCPDDISATSGGDLSFVVNGGMGFTAEIAGRHDCFVDADGRRVDMNANGVLCPVDDTDDGDPSDRTLFFRMRLFFNETWKWDVTKRRDRIGGVVDGLSQTMLMTENVRMGYDPAKVTGNWATNSPYLTSLYIGNPCPTGTCGTGAVDYGRSNAGSFAINSGLQKAEGASPIPNSFYRGGVNMAFCDGRVQFFKESVDGGVYAALASPQGSLLSMTPLTHPGVSDDAY